MGGAGGDLDLEEVEVEVEATLEELRTTQLIIAAIRDATLANGGLPEAVVERLRNAENQKLDLSEEPELLTGIEFFIDTENASEKVYANVRETYHHSLDRLGYDYNPIPSLFQLKRRISDITGVHSILHDMCPNSCIAYTGPFSDLEICPKCQTTRYDPIVLASSGGRKKIAQCQFHTIPLGPQLQALFRSPEGARAMHYRRNKTAEILAKARNNNGEIDEWSDILYGRQYLDAIQSGRIKDEDIVLLMSIDGAQLYQSKESDCWMYIWVVFDLSPDTRYKKHYVFPGGFIGGPNNPKNTDSFLLPGFHHVSALMKEGLSIWDAEKDEVVESKPYVLLGAADGPGLAYLNGLTGHSGAFGCRLYCPVKGRRKVDASHYYPALLKPLSYAVEGCDHPDVNGSHLPIGNRTEYKTALDLVLNSRTQAQHTLNRKNTGITKPSIFSGFPENHCLGVPHCFGTDLMHLISLNIPEILIKLWRGTLECDPNDDKETWDWAVLTGDVWKEHGQQVANTRPYLPGSFDRPPRNPAEKILSGYKAWEYLTYLFSLGPGLFYDLLPEKYWKNFCKLVAGVRLLHQKSISKAELLRGHTLLVEFENGFELLYYQRKESRLHFCRQSIHTLLHIGPEIPRLGPGVCYTQWTMERTIGNLGQEIRQPSNPYTNLSERGVHRSRVNAITSIVPELVREKPAPHNSEDLGSGFILSMRDRIYNQISNPEMEATQEFYRARDINVADDWVCPVQKWARLRLPNHQFVRTAWREKTRPLEKTRMSRNITVSTIFKKKNEIKL